MERQAWEQQCERLHQEVSTLSTLCNGLLRDQQLLVSTVIGRNVPSGPASSPGLHNIPGPTSLGKFIQHPCSSGITCGAGGIVRAIAKCRLGKLVTILTAR